MRVIAGQFRSRPLQAPPGMATRPTSDRLRETLFNVLTQGAADRITGVHFLDLYAGSGAVGIEALSRGATRVTFVEQASAALRVLEKNIAGLALRDTGSAGRLRIERRSAARFLRECGERPAAAPFAVVFLDPPYDATDEYTATLGALGDEASALLAPGAWVIAEHRRKHPLAAAYGRLIRIRTLEQGDAALSFYEIASSN
jgi:16S rRNA (guanine966-N2)-methyltransferase